MPGEVQRVVGASADVEVLRLRRADQHLRVGRRARERAVDVEPPDALPVDSVRVPVRERDVHPLPVIGGVRGNASAGAKRRRRGTAIVLLGEDGEIAQVGIALRAQLKGPSKAEEARVPDILDFRIVVDVALGQDPPLHRKVVRQLQVGSEVMRHVPFADALVERAAAVAVREVHGRIGGLSLEGAADAGLSRLLGYHVVDRRIAEVRAPHRIAALQRAGLGVIAELPVRQRGVRRHTGPRRAKELLGLEHAVGEAQVVEPLRGVVAVAVLAPSDRHARVPKRAVGGRDGDAARNRAVGDPVHEQLETVSSVSAERVVRQGHVVPLVRRVSRNLAGERHVVNSPLLVQDPFHLVVEQAQGKDQAITLICPLLLRVEEDEPGRTGVLRAIPPSLEGERLRLVQRRADR